MKKISTLWILSVTAAALCGCTQGQQSGAHLAETDTQTEQEAQTELSSTEYVPEKTYTFPKTYQAEGENITVDLTIEAPEHAYFLEGTMEELPLDQESIAKQLMADVAYDLDTYQILSKEITEEGYYKKMCYWGDLGLTYDTYPYIETESCLNVESKSSDYNLSSYAEPKAFAFASEEEAWTKVMETLQQLGIVLDEKDLQVDTYYLDHETLQQEESHFDIDGNREEEKYKTDWSEADDAYLFYIHQTYCGLRDYHTTEYWAGRAEESNAQITAAYNQDGLGGLTIAKIATYTTTEKEVALLSFDEVVNSLITHYENILDDTEYTVTSACLCCDYQSAGKLAQKKMIPIWAFTVIETKDGISSNYEVRLNAETGEFL